MQKLVSVYHTTLNIQVVSPFSGLNSVPNLIISGHRSINKNSPLNRDNPLNRSPLNRDTTEVCKSVLPDGGRVKFISVMDSKLLASFDGFERGHALDVTEARVLKVVHLTVGSERMLNLKILGFITFVAKLSDDHLLCGPRLHCIFQWLPFPWVCPFVLENRVSEHF